LEFSVSACSRKKSENERNGVDYWFLTAEEFRQKIDESAFVEFEEVYPGSFYGTLKTELERIWQNGKIPIFDVDVVGGLNLKKYFGDKALSIFIQPPSIEELESRLKNRGTETDETIEVRIGKAKEEMTAAAQFDAIMFNDDLDRSSNELISLVSGFLF
ncbi:MAG: guanylate kinase, partial [Bacteroidota bacterium]